MVRAALKLFPVTCIIASPFPMAVAFPLGSTKMTEGFELDQNGNPIDGGAPSPSSNVTLNDTVSPIRIVSTDGEIRAAITGANTTDAVGALGLAVGAAGFPAMPEQLAKTAISGIVKANRIRPAERGLQSAMPIHLGRNAQPWEY